MDTPIRMLELIVDEVEGLRRTDARSFLPPSLLRRAREVLVPHTAVAGSAGVQLTDVDDLEGHAIAHVFHSGLKRGKLVLVTADGSFIVLDVESDDEDASISVVNRGRFGEPRKLQDYVFPRELANAGLLSAEDKARIDREEQQAKVDEARRRVAAAHSALDRAEQDLARLMPKEPADGTPA